jgi:hypothetical protein
MSLRLTPEQFNAHQAKQARTQFGPSFPRRSAQVAAELANLAHAPAPEPAPTVKNPTVTRKRSISDARAKVIMLDLCRAAGLPVPVGEYRFHPGRRWQFDYAWPDYKLALELEGGIWTQGAHAHPLNIERDIEKYTEAAILGWRILRVQPADIVTRGLDIVMRAFAAMR